MTITMAQNPYDPSEIQMAVPAMPPETLAPPPRAQMAVSVPAVGMSASPHDTHMAATLTAPISAAPPKMATTRGDGPAPAVPRMSLLAPQEQRASNRLMADYRKEDDPYGSPDNHPGFLGKLLHGLNVATGGTGRMHIDEKRQAAHLEDLSKEESTEGLQAAQGQEAEARIPLETAQGQLAQAQADLVRQGKGWKVEFSPGGEPLQVTNGVQSYLSGESGIPAEAQQVLDTAMGNYQTKQDQDLQKQQKPLSKQQADALNTTWDGIAKQYHLPTGQFREGMPSADAAQIASSFNNVIGRGQGQQRITVQAGNTGSARADKSFQYNNGELDKLSTPIGSLVQRMGTLQTNLAQGSPQADALVAPELLSVMAGGQGSGLRMNQAEIDRIVGGRSAWENLKAAAQHWSTDPKGANSITPEQRQQIRALANAVNQKLQAKQQILDSSYEELLDTDDPKEQRRIVADTRQKLDAIDSGGSGGITVKAPDGNTYSFKDQAAADKFKAVAGIK